MIPAWTSSGFMQAPDPIKRSVIELPHCKPVTMPKGGCRNVEPSPADVEPQHFQQLLSSASLGSQ